MLVVLLLLLFFIYTHNVQNVRDTHTVAPIHAHALALNLEKTHSQFVVALDFWWLSFCFCFVFFTELCFCSTADKILIFFLFLLNLLFSSSDVC